MAKNRVVIELSAARLRIGLLRGGRVVMTRSQLIAAGSDLDALTPLALDWLEGMRASGSEAVVVYEAASVLAAVLSCPLSAGAEGAASAARLALSETAGFILNDEASDLEPLDPDRSGAAEARRHTLAVADRGDHVRALSEWARTLGLRPVALVPAAAVVLARTTRAVRAGQGLQARLWVDQSGSVLAAGSEAGLRFVRSLNLGMTALADAMTRPIRLRGSDQTVQLTRAEAWGLLEEFGIPSADQVLDAPRGLDGAAVLPLLQPVLQRLAVDLKQSLRFGLNEGERLGAMVVLDGPGARLNRLAEVLGQLSGVVVKRGEEIGAEPLWDELERLTLNLLPGHLQQEVTAERARWSMRVGLAAAMALMGLYGGHAALVLRGERAAKSGASSELAQLEERNRLTARAEEASRLEREMERRLSVELGESVPSSRVLAVLAEAVPAGIALTSINLRGEGESGPTGTLSGVIDTREAGDFSEALQRLCAALKAVPIVRSTQVGAVRREAGTGDVRQFELTLGLVAVPVSMRSLLAAGEGAGAREGAGR